MADHFYSRPVGDLSNRDVSGLTIGTSTAGGVLELRITDGSITRRQAYLFCEQLADLFASASSSDRLPSGGFTG